jgi:hypothetical protein
MWRQKRKIYFHMRLKKLLCKFTKTVAVSLQKSCFSLFFLHFQAISASANKILHSILHWNVESITRLSISLRNLRACHYKEKPMLDSRNVQTSVRVLLAGSKLAMHGVSEGTKAVTKFHMGNYLTTPHCYTEYCETYQDRYMT